MDFYNIKAPVVFIANAIGDHVIALPTLRSLHALFPKLKAILLPGADYMFFGDVDFHKKIFISIPEKKKWLIGNSDNDVMEYLDFSLLKNEIGDCDLFISLNTWHSSGIDNLLNLLNPKVSMGFYSSFSIQHQSKDGHMFDILYQNRKFFDDSVGIEKYSSPPFLAEKERALAHSFKKIVDKINYKILVVHMDTKRRKMWMTGSFQEVIDRFLEVNKNYLVCIVGGRHDIQIKKIKNSNRVIDFCGLPLTLSFGLIGCADLFLGIDSCMLHVADLYKIPSVGLFGPTESNRWGLRFARHLHIQKTLDEISVEEVLNGINSM